MPAFNEEEVIEGVLRGIPRTVSHHSLDVLVVDDGSSDGTALSARNQDVTVVSHPINRGLGAALGTGFAYARLRGYDFLVTMDSDGQHDPAELASVVEPILASSADFVVGTRIYRDGMPYSRRLVTALASMATFAFTGVWSSDSQSGFRAFSRRAMDAIKVDVDRMEVSTSLFSQARKSALRMHEVPITPIYTEYSLRKGQRLSNAATILLKLALKKLA